jgi:hypothetical protein
MPSWRPYQSAATINASCAAPLDFDDRRRRGPFWSSRAADAFLDGEAIMHENLRNAIGTYFTRTPDGQLTADYNTDSDSSKA